MSVHCSLDEFPRCADWKHLVAGFRAPECPIKVSLPCVGVYGSKACFSNVGAACQPVNTYDIEEGYADFLKHVTDGAELNLGEQRGDILNIDFTKLEDSHILLSGPPCDRGAGNVHKNSRNEKVFHKVLQIIIYLAQRGLLAFIIERGFGGSLRVRAGREGYIHTVRDALRAALPDWDLSVKCVHAAKFMLPQHGSRILLVGANNKVVGLVPRAIKQSWSDAETLLEPILNLGLPGFDRAQLTGDMQSSLRKAEMELKVMERLGKLTNKSIAVFALADSNRRIMVDRLPNLCSC